MLSLCLTGHDLKSTDLWRAAKQGAKNPTELKIEISPEARIRVENSSNYIAKILQNEKPVYGVNTGFGKFAEVAIGHDKLQELQKNLILSHSCGVGDLLDPEILYAHWLIRLNTFCRGHSGVRPSTIDFVIECLEQGLLGQVPSRGSVGASGDLSPSAHASLCLLGVGKCFAFTGGQWRPMASAEGLKMFGLKPLVLGPKEGLSLINGTQTSAALTLKACLEGQTLVRLSNLTLVLSLEGLRGTHKLFSRKILENKNQVGVLFCGEDSKLWIPSETEISKSHESCKRVQDPYSLRCAPLVHGAIWDDLVYAQKILENEINSSTDNPLVFPEDGGQTLSGGNFHALYAARAADQITSGLCTLGTISERRIATAMSKESSGLPPFLVGDGGFNSGFMMAHVTAAALASESKSLSFPASVDTIPTSDDREDHVSMGPGAAFKALTVLKNTRRILAIEILTACQAIDFLRPLKSSPALERIHARIRQEVTFLDKDRVLSDDILKIETLLENHSVEILSLQDS